MAIFASRNNGIVEQSVDARLDYWEDWSSFLIEDDTIVTSVWSADKSGLTFENESINGIYTSVFVSGGVAGTTYIVKNLINTAADRRDARYFSLTVNDGGSIFTKPLSTALFKRFTDIARFKTDSLSFVDRSFPVDQLTDDYIWDCLIAAEADASHRLRVLFEPTLVIPEDVEQAEIDALVEAGTKFVTESAYDYDPQDWSSNMWGFMLLRRKPVIDIESVTFSYPSASDDVLVVPNEWFRLDKKAGQLRFVPTGMMVGFGPLNAFMLSAISSGRTIPGMIRARYSAGLANAARDYPDLVSVVKRMAMLKMLKDGFVPQSASISADGLSQSASYDIDKFSGSIDDALEALRSTFHGPSLMVL